MTSSASIVYKELTSIANAVIFDRLNLFIPPILGKIRSYSSQQLSEIINQSKLAREILFDPNSTDFLKTHFQKILGPEKVKSTCDNPQMALRYGNLIDLFQKILSVGALIVSSNIMSKNESLLRHAIFASIPGLSFLAYNWDISNIDSIIFEKTANFRIFNSYFFHLLPLFVKIANILSEEVYLYTKNENCESLTRVLKVLDDLCEIFSWSTVTDVIFSQMSTPDLNMGEESSNGLKVIFTYKNLIVLLEFLRNFTITFFTQNSDVDLKLLKLFKTDYVTIEKIQNKIDSLNLEIDIKKSFDSLKVILKDISETSSKYNQTPKESFFNEFYSERMPKINQEILMNFLQNKFIEQFKNLKFKKPFEKFYKMQLDDESELIKSCKTLYLQDFKTLYLQDFKTLLDKDQDMQSFRNIIIPLLDEELKELKKLDCKIN